MYLPVLKDEHLELPPTIALWCPQPDRHAQCCVLRRQRHCAREGYLARVPTVPMD